MMRSYQLSVVVLLFLVFLSVDLAGCSNVSTKKISVIKQIKFKTVKEVDGGLGPGQTKVKVAGEEGFKRVTYEVTFEDGEEKSRKVIKEKIIKKSVDQVILVSPVDAPSETKGND